MNTVPAFVFFGGIRGTEATTVEEGERGSSQDITQGSRHAKLHSPPHTQTQAHKAKLSTLKNAQKQAGLFCVVVMFFLL